MKTFEKIRKSCQRKKYNRISYGKRLSLIRRVFIEKERIHDVAKELNLNYSTAKTIVRIFRREKRAMKQNGQEEKILKKILKEKNRKQIDN